MNERTYRIQYAAEMTGVSEGLIRAWERRYGILKPKRTPSGYRAYTPSDIEVLKRLKKLIEEGMSIAEAVQLLPRIKKEAKEAASEPVKAPNATQLAEWQAQVLDATQRLDQAEVERVLDEAMGALTPVAFFEQLISPIEREVGERYHRGELGIAEEHLVTQPTRQRMLLLLHRAPRRGRGHVVCACLPQEDHELGLMGAALKFRHAGWRVTYLGPRVPPEHLGRVAHSVQPDLIALSAVNDQGESAFRRALGEVVAALPEKMDVLVGGPVADRYHQLVRALGARLAMGGDDWTRLRDA